MGARPPKAVSFAVRGPIARGDLPGLCKRVCALLAGVGPCEVVCDVHRVEPDAVTVDALARLWGEGPSRRAGNQPRSPSYATDHGPDGWGL